MEQSVQYVAVFLIAAKDPVKEFHKRTEDLIKRGEITREQIPDLLKALCKRKGNAGEIGREIRKKLE
ncbi:MAG: hypothetical protein ACTSUB_06810 [Candidatus Thorarchaeota archaeon]